MPKAVDASALIVSALGRPLLRTLGALSVLAAFAAWIELHYGRLGFMPLDSSIIWDGGWRTLQGQVPLRDYTTPNGLTPIALQGLFFRIFGVSWLTYCLHAAVVNVLFSFVAYWLLLLLDLPRYLAFLYALLSAVVLYPPIGTPLMGQHSFFFMLLAVALTVAGLREPRPGRRMVFLIFVPPVETLALLSKHQPAGYGLIVIAALVATVPRRDARQVLLALLSGTVAAVVAVATVVVALRVNLDLVRLYFIDLPAETARDRIAALGHPRMWVQSWGLITPFVAYVGVAALAIFLLMRRQVQRTCVATRALILAGTFIVLTEVYIALTLNQSADGFGLLFVVLGLLHATVRRVFGPRRLAGIAVGVILVGVGAVDAWHVNRDVNATRSLNDIRYAPPSRAEQNALPDSLRFLRWSVPAFYQEQASDLGRVVAALRSARGNFLLFGDSSILYALTNRSPTAPVLWLHEGLSYPKTQGADFVDFEHRYLAAIHRYQVRRIVYERSWMGSSLADFPVLTAYLSRHGCGTRGFGGFTVLELCR